MKFGVAFRDITPSVPVWLHGYGTRDRKSDEISEPLEIACLALASENKTVLIFTFDLIGIKYHDCQNIYKIIEDATGISYPDIMISCSHTHFAPALHQYNSVFASIGSVESKKEFVENFRLKIIEAAKESLRNLRECSIDTARIKVPQVSFNRRTIKSDGKVENNYIYPENPSNYTFSRVDDELSVLRFKENSGAIGAVLVNFGCHPVVGGEEQNRDHYKISADYPWYIRQKIKDAHKCPALFTLGGAGDVVPIKRFGQSRKQIGGILGESILFNEPIFVEEKNPDLFSDLIKHHAKTIVELDPMKAEKEYEEAREASILTPIVSRADSKKNADIAMNDPYVWKVTAYSRAKAYPCNSFDIPLQFIKIGETVLISWPFEVAAEFSMRLKELYPNTILVSCSGGYQGYLMPTHEFAKGGYEADPCECHFEVSTGDALLEKSIAWLNKQ